MIKDKNIRVSDFDYNCPICNRKIEAKSKERTKCYFCNSALFLNENNRVEIIKNNVSFNRDNLLIGIVLLLIILAILVLLMIAKINLTFIGLIIFFLPLTFIIQHKLFYKSYELQEFLDLFSALFSGRLKHYDSGSKFLVFSLIFINFLGFILITIGLLT